MPHRRKPRRSKMDRQLITLEQTESADVLTYQFNQSPVLKEGNLAQKLSPHDVEGIEEMIRQRFDSAEETTNLVTKEILRAERQFKGLFSDGKFNEQKEYEDIDDGDIRIFMRKTMEHIQVVFSHLDGLTSQLNPLLVFQPSPSGIHPPQEEFERAKLKEILVEFYFKKNRFKKDVLPRWRMNFLKHPSAYLEVVYNGDPIEPDIQINLVDRGMLYIDPWIDTGDIKDAGWVIKRAVVTRDEVEEKVRQGHWHLEHGMTDLSNLFAPPSDDLVRQLIGSNVGNSDARGPERDDLIEVLYYFQAERRGMPHAYGVILGGKNGGLVRWGPNPFPYKGIPFRGKSYIRDSYKPDGTSLAMQYRSIQEVFNTFFNLRLEDVLENVKRRIHVAGQLFDETTQEDHENNQKYIRLAEGFTQQILEQGRKLSDFMMSPSDGDSTQHLLSDLQYLGGEGQSQTNINDAFRGQNPQSGATLGQVQEQLVRALGVFRPIFSQEMALCEEIGEIVSTYFSDPDFFGPERIISIIGHNRYTKTVRGFFSDGRTGISARRVTPDEMDVDVTIDAINQAEKMASKTLRMQQRGAFFEYLRHHPELAKEAARTINFSELFLSDLRDMGEDIEAITFTPEEQEKRAQEQEQQKQQAMQQEVQFEAQKEEAKEGAKTKREVQVQQIKAGFQEEIDDNKIDEESEAKIREIAAKAFEDHKAEMAEMLQDHQLKLERMQEEARLEIAAAKAGVNVSIKTGGNSINSGGTT